MSNENGQVQLLIAQLKQAAGQLRDTLEELPNDVAHAVPDGKTNTIAANSAHAVATIDGLIHGMIKGEAPLGMSMETGLSAPPPQGFEWGDWGRTVQVNLDSFHEYAGKTVASAIEYLGTLSDADLSRTVKGPTGVEMSVAQWVTIAILNTAWHTGEVAALKGTHGLKGYSV